MPLQVVVCGPTQLGVVVVSVHVIHFVPMLLPSSMPKIATALMALGEHLQITGGGGNVCVLRKRLPLSAGIDALSVAGGSQAFHSRP